MSFPFTRNATVTLVALALTAAVAGAAERSSSRKPAAPAPMANKKESKDDATLPGGKWNTKALEQNFRIVKTKFDATDNKVVWLAERTTDGFVAFDVAFYDEEDVKLTSAYVDFDPSVTQVAKGERTRASVTLPKDEILKKVVRVVISKR